MDRTGVHSLRAAEEFVMRDISEASSKIEKDCFQIAFVIFVMGHVLAPRTKHDYGTIDYWGALANTENITQYNWCEFVLEFLLEAVRRLKNDMMANNHSTNLVGCHLFLQVCKHVFFSTHPPVHRNLSFAFMVHAHSHACYVNLCLFFRYSSLTMLTLEFSTRSTMFFHALVISTRIA